MELDGDKPSADEGELPNPPPRRRRWGLAIQLAAAIGFVLLAAFYFLPTPGIAEMLEIVRDWGLVPFYLAFVVLALLGFPSTPFFLLGGAAFPVVDNLVAIAFALIIHFTLAWLISAKWMRGWIKAMLLRRGISLPEVRADNQWRIALLVKFAPGVPLFLKSYLLGVTGVAFIPFMVICGLSTFAFAAAFVTMGRSAIEGQVGLLFGGLGFLIFCMALFRVVREYLRAKRADKDLLVD